MMMLDASKAFDRVDHIKLFKIISKKGVYPKLLKLLFNMYSQQTMSVRWDIVVSQPFKAGNGVKQGGVLYPILYTLYLDELMDMVKSSGFGCYVGNVFAGTYHTQTIMCYWRPTVEMLDQRLGPTLYKWYTNILYLA